MDNGRASFFVLPGGAVTGQSARTTAEPVPLSYKEGQLLASPQGQRPSQFLVLQGGAATDHINLRPTSSNGYSLSHQSVGGRNVKQNTGPYTIADDLSLRSETTSSRTFTFE